MPHEGKKNYDGGVLRDIFLSFADFRDFFSLKAMLTTFTLHRKCKRERGPGKFLVTGASQISIPLSKSLRVNLQLQRS